jgi:hypothetical protein
MVSYVHDDRLVALLYIRNALQHRTAAEQRPRRGRMGKYDAANNTRII